MKSLGTSVSSTKQRVSPGAVITALHSSTLTHVDYFPWLVALGLKIDMRKVFRFAISAIINLLSSWMTTWCASNPTLQGNLVQTMLAHQI